MQTASLCQQQVLAGSGLSHTAGPPSMPSMSSCAVEVSWSSTTCRQAGGRQVASPSRDRTCRHRACCLPSRHLRSAPGAPSCACSDAQRCTCAARPGQPNAPPSAAPTACSDPQAAAQAAAYHGKLTCHWACTGGHQLAAVLAPVQTVLLGAGPAQPTLHTELAVRGPSADSDRAAMLFQWPQVHSKKAVVEAATSMSRPAPSASHSLP